MRTRKEIDDLKNDWLLDPCFDLWDTEGFEDHLDELRAFQEKQELIWHNREQERLFRLADKYGCAGNTVLARTIERLFDEIERLRSEILG